MAFPGLTSDYEGTNPSQDSGPSEHYNSLFETMFVVDTFTPTLEPYFSIAISRDESGNGYGGAFVIGGVPDPNDPHINSSDSTAASTPLVAYNSGSDYSYYAIDVDSIWAAGTQVDYGTTVVIDSGAPYLYLPQDAADAFNAAWSPAGQANSGGVVIIDCAATTPGLAIGVGGQWLPINSLDLVMNGGSYCYSAVQVVSDSTSDIYILGDPFLKNVVAVYDWGNSAMEYVLPWTSLLFSCERKRLTQLTGSILAHSMTHDVSAILRLFGMLSLML
jgi:Eukaryotic aspartyl protease